MHHEEIPVVLQDHPLRELPLLERGKRKTCQRWKEMKKIMFNDSYGLTKAVLEGRKIMTRRMIKIPPYWRGQWVWGAGISGKTLQLYDADEGIMMDEETGDYAQICPKFKVGEVVAVAQSYEDIGLSFIVPPHTRWGVTEDMSGYRNKMFVLADLMPHQIRITNVRVERLQDISDEDCRKEGIDYVGGYSESYYFGHGVYNIRLGNSYREAFASLINKVSGKCTWESNPWVFVYEFELVQ